MLKSKNLFKNAINFLLVSYPAALSAEKKIRLNIEKIKKSKSDKDSKIEKLSIDLFKSYQNKCYEDKSVIEAKAKSNLLGVTLAFSVIFASFGLMTSESARSFFNGIQALIIFIPILAGVFYLLLGGIAALKALQIRKWYDLSLKEEINIDDSLSKKKKMKKYIEINNLTNLMRTNYTTVSQKSIRNGILFLALFVFLMALLLITNNSN